MALEFKLPDIGEGVAEAEVIEWHVKPGDSIREDQVLAAVMTEKATVEIPSPFEGTVVSLGAEAGSILAVGAELARIDAAGVPDGGQPAAEEHPKSTAVPAAAIPSEAPRPPHSSGEKPMASPAVRKRASDSGLDLRSVEGTGPEGRILHRDLDAAGSPGETGVETVKVIGHRRQIARRMAEATRRIAHFSYVEEIDVTALEELRAERNSMAGAEKPKLTLLPFLIQAIVAAVREFPQINAHFDDEAEVIRRFAAVHAGIATQAPAGLLVPVLRHAETRDLWDCAAEIKRLADKARDGTATREELTGSTITITSLGALGGIMATPVINLPEVAIVGVNRIAIRPVWHEDGFVPRKMMNLSSSFDHRVIDGYDAARFVQAIKAGLEAPRDRF